MSKLANTSILLLGVTLLLQLAGIPTGLQSLFNLVGLNIGSSGLTGFSGQSSTFAQGIIGVGGLFALAGAAGIIGGLLTRCSFEWAVLAAYASGIVIIFIATFVSIINYAASMDGWIRNSVIFVYGLLGVAFIWGVMDWVFNRE